MGVTAITVVTLMDGSGRIPAFVGEAHPDLWKVLTEWCYASLVQQRRAADEDSPRQYVVLRSSEIAPGSLALLPRATRPVVRTRSDPTAPFYITTETHELTRRPPADGSKPGEPLRISPPPRLDTEWSSVLNGIQYLNSGARGTAPVHLWILGAADLCDQVLLAASRSTAAGAPGAPTGARLTRRRPGLTDADALDVIVAGIPATRAMFARVHNRSWRHAGEWTEALHAQIVTRGDVRRRRGGRGNGRERAPRCTIS
ncbi:virion protein US2 [Suid alphaherpesvirus 1]|uniref:Virion protein US2 n=1 Tax=Suid herpesvirus 1 TaxID=10345 RepID=A0A0S2MM86_SUHV|nr:virion protein US2 [Suid alphaherpesvirus 1]ALO75802.1 virion protein US2 [Suid alphaherpesvirus 1]